MMSGLLDRGRASVAQSGSEIGVEVRSARRPGQCQDGLGLPRSLRDADATMALAGRDRGDPEWAGTRWFSVPSAFAH